MSYMVNIYELGRRFSQIIMINYDFYMLLFMN